eukprot:CAMPEP_0179939824 /NCGR_PEP_ID=MMETSP0983-20121128/15920_1 /TAXON_ID=483367 /ORGANISM="non described non described, Strain CCMP 2436" /LENGTH=55 /DNA_ID=CAMNT_0021846347 /DNA_START=72 /DNA_END=236 /DNA_ORIENTATION=+
MSRADFSRISKRSAWGGSYWPADGILYGYCNPSLFTVSAVPDVVPFVGSSKVHMS